ncbi:MAG: hypothetical protein AB1555_12480 [Nitrospirota bacterium]
MMSFRTLLNDLLYVGLGSLVVLIGLARADRTLVTKPSKYSVPETINGIEEGRNGERDENLRPYQS